MIAFLIFVGVIALGAANICFLLIRSSARGNDEYDNLNDSQ